jgi:cytochrome c553
MGRRAALLLAVSAAAVQSAGQTPVGPVPLPPQVTVCMACHGEQGVSASPEIPNLAGQKEVYLREQLRAFRNGRRKSELMNPLAEQLDDETIALLATYWSRVSPPRAPEKEAAQQAAAARVPSRMQFPADFPNGFTPYGHELVAGQRIVQVRYANAVAWDAMRAGRELPEGSIVIAANHVAMRGDSGEMQAGEARSYVGMQSQAGWGAEVPALLRNGNWQFGFWSATRESRLGGQHAQCLACHKPRANDNHLFSAAQFRAAAGQPPR